MNSTNCRRVPPVESNTDSVDHLPLIIVLSMTCLVLIAVALPVLLWIDSLHQEIVQIGRAVITDLFHEQSRTMMMSHSVTSDSPAMPQIWTLPESWSVTVQLGDQSKCVTVDKEEWYRLRRGETVNLLEKRGVLSSRIQLQPLPMPPENSGH